MYATVTANRPRMTSHGTTDRFEGGCAGAGAGRTSDRVMERYVCWTIRTSSTPASTRLPVPASAAEMRMRTDWPAYADRLADAVAQAPARLVAAPSCWNTCVVPPLWTTLTR